MKETMATCLFCKIVKGEIPCFKLCESERLLAFMDINPLATGHALVIPKLHAAKLVDVPDDHLKEILPMTKRIATAIDAENYNILQNNGRLAHQEVDHVHFHIIPKPSKSEGLGVHWPSAQADFNKLEALANSIASRV